MRKPTFSKIYDLIPCDADMHTASVLISYDVDDPPTDSVDYPRPRVYSSAAIDQSSINEAVMKAFSNPGVL